MKTKYIINYIKLIVINTIINLKDLLNIILNRRIYIRGNYSTYESARENSTGYDNDLIIKKKIIAFNQILKKKAIYEQDTKLFYKEELDYNLISLIRELRLAKSSAVNILDYGGSFGSKYFKNYSEFKKNNLVNWTIIEQDKIVDYVNKNHFNIKIDFFKKIEDCNSKDFDLCLFSSSLQYLSNPYKILEKIVKKKINRFYFMKTPFDFENTHDKICIQYVPKNIYNASYPIKIFSYVKFKSFFEKNNYTLLKENKNLLIDNIPHIDLMIKKNHEYK